MPQRGDGGHVWKTVVVFNLIALAEFLLGWGVYYGVALIAPGIEYSESARLLDTNGDNLVLWLIMFAITGASEWFGFRGRLFWLPTHAFAGLALGAQLAERLGTVGWILGFGLSLFIVGASWWKHRNADDVSEADAHRALGAAEQAIATARVGDAWDALETAFIGGTEPSAAVAMHNRRVLHQVYRLVAPQHQASLGPLFNQLDAAYATVEAGGNASAELPLAMVVPALIESKGELNDRVKRMLPQLVPAPSPPQPLAYGPMA
ncbi:MAG: hypothetical protein AAGA54_16370 [Myxococcota bacterium]